MKQSQAFHKGIRRVWSRLSAVSGTSRLGQTGLRFFDPLPASVSTWALFSTINVDQR